MIFNSYHFGQSDSFQINDLTFRWQEENQTDWQWAESCMEWGN